MSPSSFYTKKYIYIHSKKKAQHRRKNVSDRRSGPAAARRPETPGTREGRTRRARRRRRGRSDRRCSPGRSGISRRRGCSAGLRRAAADPARRWQRSRARRLGGEKPPSKMAPRDGPRRLLRPPQRPPSPRGQRPRRRGTRPWCLRAPICESPARTRLLPWSRRRRRARSRP